MGGTGNVWMDRAYTISDDEMKELEVEVVVDASVIDARRARLRDVVAATVRAQSAVEALKRGALSLSMTTVERAWLVSRCRNTVRELEAMAMLEVAATTSTEWAADENWMMAPPSSSGPLTVKPMKSGTGFQAVPQVPLKALAGLLVVGMLAGFGWTAVRQSEKVGASAAAVVKGSAELTEARIACGGGDKAACAKARELSGVTKTKTTTTGGGR